MVNTKKKFEEIEHTEIEVPETDIPDDKISWCSVLLSEVLNNYNRFEASAYSLEAKNAREEINNSKYPSKKLYGNNGFSDTAFYPGRFKRTYISNGERSIGFLGSSEMLEINPKPVKYLNKEQEDLKSLFVKRGDVLLSRSGTIGNIAYVSKTLQNFLVSEHSIRLRNIEYSGYIYAFLKTPIGQCLIKTNTFGSVVSQIEPKHLENIEIPNPPEILKKEIHNLIVKSYDLRDESNDLIDEAEKLLIQELKLPPIEDFKPKYYNQNSEIRNFEVSLSKLNNRFDASYHVPIVDCIVEHLKTHSKALKKIGDEDISARIILAGVFKRTYVKESEGVPFLGGKDIMQLSPSVEKFLSRKVHEKLIKKSLEVRENMLLITDRGTIGNVMIVPKHFEGWAVSQNVIKVEFASDDIAGYVYTYLNSQYGQVILQRETYGSVINMVDDKNIERIPIPILNNKDIQDKINALVLQANKKRYEAYILEQKAIKMVNEKVIYTN